MQIEIGFRDAIVPKWSKNESYYTLEYAENEIKALQRALDNMRRVNLSLHMDTYYTDGIKYWSDWILVLNEKMPLSDFEDKWEKIIKKYAKNESKTD